MISPSGVWRVLRRHGLNTRARRLGLVAGYAAPPQEKPLVLPTQHLQVETPGELVQMDCFYVGRLQGVKGTVWQYTAIDVASCSPGPSCGPPPAIQLRCAPVDSLAESPKTWRPEDGNWKQ